MSFKSTLPDTLATRLASIPKPVYLTAIPASIATLLLLRAALGSGSNRTPDPAQQKVVPSPLHSLTVDEADELPYAPDSLPGARDVDSPWGSIRVYEWGPVQGKKVLLVHGISTPSVAMSKVAEGLVDKGCRVMLFDLFGRGFSDSVSNTAHDVRLYTSQILLCLASSPLSWTGSYTVTRHGKTVLHKNSFSMIGFSFGGVLSMAFTSYFPDLVDSLVLIAPGGFIREHHISFASKMFYGGWLPASWTRSFVQKRALSNETPKGPKDAGAGEVDVDIDEEDAEDSLQLTAAAAARYQLENHPGFIPAFVSSLQHCPIYYPGSKPLWATIAARLPYPPEPEPELEAAEEVDVEAEAEAAAEEDGEDDEDEDEFTELPAVPQPERALSPGRAPSVRSTRSTRSSRSSKSGKSSSKSKSSKSSSSKHGKSSSSSKSSGISSWFSGSSSTTKSSSHKSSSSKSSSSKPSSKSSSSSKHRKRSQSVPSREEEKVRVKEKAPEPVDVVKESLKEEESNSTQGKILFVLGREDKIIIEEEIREDACRVLGEANLEFVTLDAGHDLPLSHPDDVVGAVAEFWGISTPVPTRRSSRVAS